MAAQGLSCTQSELGEDASESDLIRMALNEAAR